MARKNSKSRKKKKQRLCLICKKRPTWRYKNNPGNAYCKRCYHKHIWPDIQPQKKNKSIEFDDLDTEQNVTSWEF